MAWLILGAALVAAGSVLVAAMVRPGGWTALLLAAAIAAFAQVVVLAELLSLAGGLGRAGWLAGHGALAVLAAVAWRRQRPAWPPRRRVSGQALRERPVVAAACAAAGLAAAFQLVVGLTTPPSNWDSMTYHLSRAAYWLQEGSITHFDGGSVRQLASAPNAEIGLAWTMALLGSDGAVALVQWLALLASGAAVVLIVRELGAGGWAAAFAGAVWVLLPGPLVQAATTQNDLVTSAALLAAVAFGLRGLRRRSTPELAVAGAAFGLALGTKGTVLFALAPLALLLAAAAWQLRPGRRPLAHLLAACLAGAVVLGAFGYVENLRETGSPVGDLPELAERDAPAIPNAVRVAWSFVESPGVSAPWVDRALARTLGRLDDEDTPEWFDYAVDTTTGEDTVAAGLVGWLVLPVLVLWAVLGRRRPPLVRAFGAAAALYVGLFGLLHVATPYNGRVLLPAVALAVPLLGLAATRGWVRGAVLVLALASALPVLLTNPASPVLADVGSPTVWDLSRAQAMTISRPDQLPVVEAVERLAPGSRVGFLGGEDSWDYPLFGARRQRTVVRADPSAVPADPPEAICAWLRRFAAEHRLDAIVVSDAPREVPTPPEVLGPRELSSGHYLVDAARLAACPAA